MEKRNSCLKLSDVYEKQIPKTDQPSDTMLASLTADKGMHLSVTDVTDVTDVANVADTADSNIGADSTTPVSLVPVDTKNPYELLYPDLYCSESNEGIVTNKTVYITFDDGPSKLTPEILKILRENNIKATFFVIGKTDESSKKMMKQIVDEGHTIAIHSYTHDYRKIYASVEAYLEDFYQMYHLIDDATGIKTSIYRFPGGSINSYNQESYKEIIEEMKRRGFTYFDWNVSAADSDSNATAKSITRNVLTQVSEHSRSIVLFHDSAGKNQTVKSLDDIIKDLKNQGYSFDCLTNKIKPIVFNINE